MKFKLYAVIAAFLAMLATSSLVALATAAPSKPATTDLQQAEEELVKHLDNLIEARLLQIKQQLSAAMGSNANNQRF